MPYQPFLPLFNPHALVALQFEVDDVDVALLWIFYKNPNALTEVGIAHVLELIAAWGFWKVVMVVKLTEAMFPDGLLPTVG